MDITEGNRRLSAWLKRSDTPTQRELARRLGLQQPVISRHSTAGQPTLKFILLYRRLAGIPVEAWLRPGESELLREVDAQAIPREEAATPSPSSLRVKRRLASVRSDLMLLSRGRAVDAAKVIGRALKSLSVLESDLVDL